MTGRTATHAAWLLLPLVALAYLALGVDQGAQVPSDADWQTAAGIVRAGWQEGDEVVFSPPWAHAGAHAFEGLVVDDGEAWDAYEMSRANRVWVVASPDARDPRPPDGFTARSRTDAGAMAVHLWTPPESPRPVYDLLEHLDAAKVARIREDGRQECRLFSKGQWHCGTRHPWMYVGPHDRDIAGRVRRVIYAHAVDPGKTLEVAWPDLPPARRLTMHFGQTQRAIERDDGAPVHVTVRIGDRVVLERTLPIHDPEWHRADFELDPARPEGFSVQVETTANNWRQFCFTADLWE